MRYSKAEEKSMGIQDAQSTKSEWTSTHVHDYVVEKGKGCNRNVKSTQVQPQLSHPCGPMRIPVGAVNSTSLAARSHQQYRMLLSCSRMRAACRQSSISPGCSGPREEARRSLASCPAATAQGCADRTAGHRQFHQLQRGRARRGNMSFVRFAPANSWFRF